MEHRRVVAVPGPVGALSERPAVLLWPWVLMVLVLAGTVASNSGDDRVVPRALGVVLAVGAVVPAVLPIGVAPALLSSGALTGMYFAAGYADGPVYLALPAVTVVAAFRATPRRWVPLAASAVVLGVAGLVVGTVAWPRAESAWQGVGLLAITAAAGAVSTAVRTRQDALADRGQRAATEEQLRMAHDLHDGVGHGLAVIAMQAGVALHVLDEDPASARRSLEAIRDTSRSSLRSMRAELAAISGEPAARRPAPGVSDLDALIARVRAAGLRVEMTGDPSRLSEATGAVVYAVVQEALTNVLRHAGATRAAVTIVRAGDRVIVTITDDGAGHVAATGDGFGIAGMRRRVEAHAGVFEAGPQRRGFRVRAELPA